VVIALLSNPGDVAWFACLAFPLAAADQRDAKAYLAALGYSDGTEVAGVRSWRDAEGVIRDPDWDERWWTREERERERLMAQARGQLGEAALLERLTAATELACDAIHGAAAIAAERDGVADAALVRAASGAASMALHAAALARLAGQGPEHLFMRKYALFESGRWPLGVVGGRFHLF
jgi:hypothetical protein